MRDRPAAIKIRFDNPRTQLDRDIPGDIAKARAVRKLVGDDFPLAFDANNGFTTGGAIRVGRALEELGFWWFEEPVQHYHVKAMGEIARALDITVSAGEQTYTLAALADLIDAGVIFGSGFAPFRGGPLTYARKRGVDVVVARLQELSKTYGPRFAPDIGWSEVASVP